MVDKDGMNLALKVIMPRKDLSSDLFLGDGASVTLLTLSWVWAYSLRCYQVSQIFNRGLKEPTLQTIQSQAKLLEAGQH